MISLKNVTKAYGNKIVLEDFSLEVEENKIICILGESGSGKTTILNILASSIPYFGSVQGIGRCAYIFQEPRLLPNLTVKENLKLVCKEEGKIRNMLATVSLAEKENAYPHTLSGGEKQRASLARAFLYPSDTVLMDEPFTALDIKLKIRLIQDFYRLLSKDKKTVFFVTHSVEEAVMISDEIVLLKDGRVEAKFENIPDNDYFSDNPLKKNIYRHLLN